MKNFKCIITAIILTSLFACEPPVTFEEPQPPNTDNLSKFPKRLQGRYLSLNDSSALRISEHLIQRIYSFYHKIHISELESDLRLSGDTLINIETNERIQIRRIGDTLIRHFQDIDTLFSINEDHILRKFKGYYFLNKRYGEQGWEVKKVHLSKGQLTIGSISKQVDLDNLKEITEIPQDTIPTTKFKVTKKQFREFIKNDGFSDSEIFVK